MIIYYFIDNAIHIVTKENDRYESRINDLMLRSSLVGVKNKNAYHILKCRKYFYNENYKYNYITFINLIKEFYNKL